MTPKLKREEILLLHNKLITQLDFVNALNKFVAENKDIKGSDKMVIRTKNQDFALQSVVFDRAENEFIIDLSFIEVKVKEKNVSNKNSSR